MAIQGAEANKYHVKGKTIFIRNTAKRNGTDAFTNLPRENITGNFARNNLNLELNVIRTNRGQTYLDAYAFAFAASGGEPIDCIGDKAVTNSLISQKYLIYDPAMHKLRPGQGLPENPTSQRRPGNKPDAFYQAICVETIAQKKGGQLPAQRDGNAVNVQQSKEEYPNSVLQDFESIELDETIDNTTRQTLKNARLGQGKFRRDVIALWNGACVFSGCKTEAVLRASHIKPWRDCSHSERLDPNNGLLLSANLDALFDRYLISFTDEGQILVSPFLSVEEQEFFSLREGCLRRNLSKSTRNYLAHHRKIFRAE